MLLSSMVSGIKSVQRGVVSANTVGVDVTITSVNTAKSVITNLGINSSSGYGGRVELTSATNVRCYGNAVTANVGWQVVEFY